MLESLFDKSEQFYKHFGDAMLELSKDPVIIVQISLAISIVSIL
jgi:hypothetical protein